MTHTRYAFVRADRPPDIVSKQLDGLLQLIPVQQVGVFDAPGPAGDCDRHRPVAAAVARRQYINPAGTD